MSEASETSEVEWLPTSDVIITCKVTRARCNLAIISALEKIVKAFEDTIQIDLIRQRWEEIKMLQRTSSLSLA